MTQTACPVCARLPRQATWTHRHQQPECVARLVDEDPHLRCPICERRYVLVYEEERDDLDLWETWTFLRLTPPETLRRLAGQAHEAYRRNYPALLARLRAELLDPDGDVRAEAAVDLAADLVRRDALTGSGWSELEKLLREVEEDAVARVLEHLDGLEMDLAPLVPLVRALLCSPSHGVRLQASRIQARHAIANGDVAMLRRLLDTNDAALPKGALARIQEARGKGLDVAPLFDLLVKRRHHPDGEVRRPAQRILLGMGPAGSATDPLPLFLEDLGAPSPELRLDAARQVATLARDRPDAVQAMPGILAMLASNRTTYGALMALRTMAQYGIPASDAIPTLVERVVSTSSAHRHDLMKVLMVLVEKGGRVTPHLRSLATLLPECVRMRSAVTWLLTKEMEAGADLGAVEGSLRAALQGPDDYSRSAVKELVDRWEAPGPGRSVPR